MWIQDPGEINDRLMLLGTRKSTLYLVRGDRYMLIGGGGQWVVPELERQIREFQIDMDRVQYLLISHTHYDHCGAVPYLQKRYPHIKVLASQETSKLFAMEKAVRNMRTFSRQAMDNLGLPMEFQGISLDFDGVDLARELQEGDRVDLGDNLQFEVYETPGHSRCSITIYAPEQKWLFPSDSLCIPVGDGNEFISTAHESFAVFLNSLKKIENLEVHLCAWEHHGVMTDKDAQDIVKRVIRYTLEYKRKILELLDEYGDQEKVAHWAARDFQDRSQFDFIPYDIGLHISRGVVTNAIKEQIEETDYI